MYHQFEEITISQGLREMAREHAIQRTRNIVRQFVPQNAPLTPVESNYVGAIGEIAVRLYLNLNSTLDDNYHLNQVDDGDLEYNELVYDVKTDAVISTSYQKLYHGTIKPYEPYACRVFTTKHEHHLYKYTGGLIFTVFQIPNNAKATKINGQLRPIIFNNDKVLIIGYVKQNEVKKNPPTWFTPENPFNGRKLKFNSKNYIFPFTDLDPISDIVV